jgi:hypothetical protein
MSEATYESGQANGHAIGEEDLAVLLEKERHQSRLLKAELEAERTHRSRAETAATSAATQRLDTEEAAVEARLSGAEDEAKRLRKEASDAMAEGRFDDAADANDRLYTLRAQQQQDRQYKAWLAGEKARVAQIRTSPTPAAPDQGIDLSSYTAGQRRWIEQNPEFHTDEKVRLKTVAGHNLAVAAGAKVDSPEYFDIINETVHGPNGRQARRNGADDGAGYDGEDGHEGSYAPVPDMPVTRRAQTPPGRQMSYRLTPLEKEAADTTMPDVPIEGFTDQQTGKRVMGRYEKYAYHRAKLREQGRG